MQNSILKVSDIKNRRQIDGFDVWGGELNRAMPSLKRLRFKTPSVNRLRFKKKKPKKLTWERRVANALQNYNTR